jgi:glycosyltransferase involved in cell wall biosynthesis
MCPTVAVVIPAYNEQVRIRATVEAARTIPEVSAVVVVDDGSTDATSVLAQEAGAIAVRHTRNLGKGSAITTGAAVVAELDAQEGRAPRHLLFLDADLQETALEAAPLVTPIVDDAADMSIGVLPRGAPGGGWGFVVRLSSGGIERMTGWTPTQPLSGQRCLTRRTFDQLVPLARGFGVEVGLTIDALQRGLRVVEVPVNLAHRVTGTSLGDRIHRARQWRDVARALAVRGVRQRFSRRRAVPVPPAAKEL